MAINESTVLTTHPCYLQITKRAELVRKIVANDAKQYLPDVDPTDWVRNQTYKDMAILTNYTKLTLNGFKGLVFRKPSEIEIPSDLDYLLVDANGEGLGLEQLAMYFFDEIQMTGNVFALVDYPQVAADDISQIDKEEAGYLARIKPYVVENVINFKMRHVGSKHIPWLIVLREYVEDEDSNIFSWDQKEQYRILMLDAAGNYCYWLMTPDDKMITEPVYPRDFNGNMLKEIPFKFIGSVNNDYKYDEALLYDIAVENLGHYRNSADFEESVFINGQALVSINVGDMDPTQFVENNPQGLKFGSRNMVVVGQGGMVNVAQVNPNLLCDKAMQRKEEQIVSIGARIIAPAGAGRETAEGARIRYGSQNSSLYITTSNISDGLTDLIRWVAQFQGVDIQSCEMKLNTQFYDDTADPNLLTALIMGVNTGIWAKNDVRDYARKAGAISEDRTNEQIDAEADVLDPLESVNGGFDKRLTQASDIRSKTSEE